MKAPNCPVCEGQAELYNPSKSLWHCYFCGTTFTYRQGKWGWSRYERTHWVREDGRKLYIGHFEQDHGPECGWTRAEVRFWAMRPIVALRQICKSGEAPATFADKVVN